MRNDRIYLGHVRECNQYVEEFTTAGRAAFLADRKTQDAVLRNLQTLAESASRLSPELQARRSEVHWRGIAGFRNVLVHDYLGTNLERVWIILERDLPVLKAAVDTLLHNQP